MRPILINKRVAKTTFQIQPCAENDKITIELTRVGGNSDTLVYPAFDVTDHSITFMWDNALYTARKGRWQGIIRMGDCKPICVPIHLDTCTCTMGANENGYFISKECTECSQ